MRISGYGSKAVEAPAARWLGMLERVEPSRFLPHAPYRDWPCWGAFGTLPNVLQAAAEGLGFALLPNYIGDAHPALRRLPDLPPVHAGDLWLLVHPDLRHTARVRAARAVITEMFQEQQASF